MSGRRTGNKLSKLFKIIDLAKFHPSEHTGMKIREVSSDEGGGESRSFSMELQ